MPIEIKDIAGLEKSITKLVEVVADGVGVVGNAVFEFDAKKIKRIGKAEAEKSRAKIVSDIEAKIEVAEISLRAQKRFALEQFDKQLNIENVIAKAKEYLIGEEGSDNPVDSDWIRRFMGVVQDVGRDDVQDILAKILAGEVKEPQTFHYRTLDFVKNLTKNDLTLFKKISVLINNRHSILIDKNTANDGFFNISYSEIMELIEMGLLQSSTTTKYKLEAVSKDTIFSTMLRDGRICDVEFTSELGNVELPIIQTTKVGDEIASCINLDEDDSIVLTAYIQQLEKFYSSKGYNFIARK